MSTPTNPGWASGFVPSAAEWAAAFSGKVDYPAPAGQGGTGLTALPAAGQILIGTGTGYMLNQIDAGSGINITVGPGTIEISSTNGSAADAFNAYGLQWAIWFNSAPLADEIIALYTSPINYEYPANFASSVAGDPIFSPDATYVLRVQRRCASGISWTDIGTITISTGGNTTFATTGGAAIPISVGDTLRVIGSSTPDASISGYSATLKGMIV